MGPNEAALQSGPHVAWDVSGGQCAESGGYPVDGGRVGGQRFDVAAALLDRLDRVVGELDRGAPSSDRNDVVEADRTHADGDCHDANLGPNACRAAWLGPITVSDLRRRPRRTNPPGRGRTARWSAAVRRNARHAPVPRATPA